MSMQYRVDAGAFRKYLLKRWVSTCAAYVGAVGHRCGAAYQDYRSWREQVQQFKAGALHRNVSVTPTYADEQFHVRLWHRYYAQATAAAPSRMKEATLFGVQMFDALLRHDATIRRVLNVGVMCGAMDFNLAVTHPAIDFHGVDLSEAVKALNMKAFSAPNLHFHAQDVVALLDQQEPFDVVMHIRTGTFLPPAELDRLYAAFQDRGVRYVLLQEPTGYSRLLGRFYNFDTDEHATLYDGEMLIHHYPKQLMKRGFRIVTQELVKTYNPTRPDIHAICVAAQREGACRP